MLLADTFSGSDAAVIITAIIAAIIPASLGIFKLLFSGNPSQSTRARLHALSNQMNKLGLELADVKVKAETVWDVFVKQAVNGIVSTGLGTMNSPLYINQEARGWLKPMESELRDWYSKNKELGERDQIVGLELNFGRRLLEEVCIPNKQIYGVCLLIAFAVASDRSTLDLPFLNSSPEVA